MPRVSCARASHLPCSDDGWGLTRSCRVQVVSEDDEFAVPIFANVVEVADEQAVQDGGYMEGTSNQVGARR